MKSLLSRIAVFAILPLITAPIHGQEASAGPALARGVKTDTVFQAAGVDNVNLFNGNLSVTVPLGSQVAVDGALDFGLSLTYNANLWEADEDQHADCRTGDIHNPLLKVRPYHAGKQANAGVGWTLSLGRIAPAGLPFDTHRRFDQMTYMAPDGSRRGFYDWLHPNTTPVPGVHYTNDGSYLRLIEDAPGCHNPPSFAPAGALCLRLEFPDGIQHEFHDVAPLGQAADWRPTYLTDPFGNGVGIEYRDDAWVISDDHDRVWTVQFDGSGQARIYSRVTSVTVPVFPGPDFPQGTATYQFQYQPGGKVIDRHQYAYQQAHCALGIEPSETLRVTVDALERILLPDGTYYAMTYYDHDASEGATGGVSGGLDSLRLPTGLEYHYAYTDLWGFNLGGRVGQAVFAPGNRVFGLRFKDQRDADGSDLGRWQYVHREALGNAPNDGSGGNGLPFVPCYHTTDVRFFSESNGSGPAERWERHYFSSAIAAFDGYVVRRLRGMPFSVCEPLSDTVTDTVYYTDWDNDGRPGPFISKQILNDDGSELGEVLRTTYVYYDEEPYGAGVKEETNKRLRVRRQEFQDDLDSQGEPHWVQTGFYDYDGLGHFRSSVTTSHFTHGRGQSSRYTAYNFVGGVPTGEDYVPLDSEPWILGTYDEVRSTEGQAGEEKARTVSCFDRSTGFLEGRRLIAGDHLGSHDVIVRYSADADGNATRELYYGGDAQSVATDAGDPCAVSGDPVYDLRHTYRAGVLESSRYYDGDEVVLTTVDSDIDVQSGLPAVSRTSAGIETEFVYDPMGRLVLEKPEERAWIRYVYDLPTEAQPNRRLGLRISTCPHGMETCVGEQQLLERQYAYDRFGRLELESRRMPVGDGSSSRLMERSRTWTLLGWPLTVGEWRDPKVGGFDFQTTYSDYDRFGRAGKVTAPDGFATDFEFDGVRATRRSALVAGPDGLETASFEEVRDFRGRLVLVREQAGPNGAWTNATYAYDEGDRLSFVCLNDADESALNGCSGGQRRDFHYDDRGFLTSETTPEIGDRSYTYDAMGKLLSIDLGGTDFDQVIRRDPAGRVTQILRPGQEPGQDDGLFLERELFYHRGSRSDGVCAGALAMSQQHNRVVLPGSSQIRDVVITRAFETSPTDGCRLAGTILRAGQVGDLRAAAFETTFSYNDLDNVTSLEYPQCLGPGCPQGEQSRLLVPTWKNGFLIGIAPFAHMEYHPTGSLAEIHHDNGVVDRRERHSSQWSPLHRITSTGVIEGGDWTYGPFTYDGAGNVSRIQTPHGDETYSFDAVGRLLSGTVHRGPSTHSQQLSYDPYGNLTSIQTDQGSESISASAATNRLISHGVAYDVAGHVTGLSVGGFDYTYTRDRFHKITRFTGGGVDQTYLYDASGERVAKIDLATGREEWTLRGSDNQVLSRYERNGESWTWTKDYIHGTGTRLASVEPGSSAETVKHFHLDHLGTTRLLTDDQGRRLASHTYYPFGGHIVPPEGAEELQFTGHERDRAGSPAGDLDYMHHRFYTPQLGRFLGVDPANTGKVATPQSWNRYIYADNNPVGYVDPDGQVAFGILKRGVKVIAKGGDVAAAFKGIIDDVNTLRDPNASFGQKVFAGLSLASEVFSPVSIKDGKAIGGALGAVAGSRRAGAGTSATRSVDPPGAQRRLEFHDVEKHGPVSRDTPRGKASKGPASGQEALNSSLPISSNSSRRVSVDPETNEFVVFDETSKGLFHGHVREWKELSSKMQAALRKAGMANKKGKPI